METGARRIAPASALKMCRGRACPTPDGVGSIPTGDGKPSPYEILRGESNTRLTKFRVMVVFYYLSNLMGRECGLKRPTLPARQGFTTRGPFETLARKT